MIFGNLLKNIPLKISMPLCKNIPPEGKPCYYTGKENTPRGRGYAAKYCEGDSKKGTDGQMYLAKGERWVKKNSRKTSPRLGLIPHYMIDVWSNRKRELIYELFRLIRVKYVKHSDDCLKRVLEIDDIEELQGIVDSVRTMRIDQYSLDQIACDDSDDSDSFSATSHGSRSSYDSGDESEDDSIGR